MGAWPRGGGVLVESFPRGELSRWGIRPGGELSRNGICSGGDWPRRTLSLIMEICPGGELSCWGIVLVGIHLGGSCPVGRCSKHSKLLADLLY